MSPHICGVERNKDRDVPHDVDSLAVRILLDRSPLAEEKELVKLLGEDLREKALCAVVQRCRIAPTKWLFPFVPRLLILISLDRSIQRVVIEPRSVVAHKSLELSAKITC